MAMSIIVFVAVEATAAPMPCWRTISLLIALHSCVR